MLLVAGLPFAPAAFALTYSTTVTQSAPAPLRAGNVQSVTATVTADGAPLEDGGIFSFSDRPFYGSLGANPPPSPIVSVAILDPFGV